MEIRKADSKGRLTGFAPGQYYFFDATKDGKVLTTPLDHLQSAVREGLDRLAGDD